MIDCLPSYSNEPFKESAKRFEVLCWQEKNTPRSKTRYITLMQTKKRKQFTHNLHELSIN